MGKGRRNQGKKQLVNRKYKDCLFRTIFHKKKDLLDLYNALNDTDYINTEDLIIYTMEDVIFLGMKNDISFLVGDTLNLYEHQSTANPNMPIRGLLYLAKNFETYIEKNNLDIFSGTLQKLPLPQFVVFYNKDNDTRDRYELELQDAFVNPKGKEACLSCKATVLNINYEHNRKLMKKCRRLEEYAIFVARVRKNEQEGLSLEDAAKEAVAYCLEHGILKDLMEREGEKMKNMVLSTWGWQNHIRSEKEKDRRAKKAQKEAWQRGREEMILKMLECKTYDDEEIRMLSGISRKRLNELKKEAS